MIGTPARRLHPPVKREQRQTHCDDEQDNSDRLKEPHFGSIGRLLIPFGHRIQKLLKLVRTHVASRAAFVVGVVSRTIARQSRQRRTSSRGSSNLRVSAARRSESQLRRVFWCSESVCTAAR